MCVEFRDQCGESSLGLFTFLFLFLFHANGSFACVCISVAHIRSALEG